MTALTCRSKNPTEWVVRRCISSFRNEYEFWPGYCERLLTLEELIDALGECARLWPHYTFSGHKIDVNHLRKLGRRWPVKRHGYAKSLSGRRRRPPDSGRSTTKVPVVGSRRPE